MTGADLARHFADLVAKAATPLEPAPSALSRLQDASRVRTFARGETIFHPGAVVDSLLFIHAGLVRYYYIDPATGAERTGQFFDEGAFVTDVASFLTGSPSVQTFDAVEATTLLAIPRAALLQAYDADHAIERFGRRMVEGALVGAQRRSANLLVLSPDERYRRFVETRPEIARRVPQYLLASHLGITPESLSRIRGRLARRPKG